MKLQANNFLIVLWLLLHTLGVTQLVSVYAKSSASLTSMMNVAEEETKTEKNAESSEYGSSEFTTNAQQLCCDPSCFNVAYKNVCAHYLLTSQFVGENTSPPPDLAV